MKSSERTAAPADGDSEPENEASRLAGGEERAMDRSTSLEHGPAVGSDESSAPAPAPGAEAATQNAPQSEDAESREQLRERIVAAIKTCYDPEIPVDIYELGLIYEIDPRDAGVAYVKMTLTSPMCPVAEILPLEVEEKVRSVEGVTKVDLELVWDPPWDIEMMSEAARLELNF
jgi:FeS assembly SUF system protein